MKFFLLFSLIMTSISSSFAGPTDVVPPKFSKGDRYVKVTQLQNNYVKFEDCIKGNEAKTCKNIGPKKSYRLEDLEDLRFNENLEATGSIAAGAALLAVGGGAIYGIMTAGTTATGLIAVAEFGINAFGVGVSVTGPFIFMAAFDPINPVLQVNQARTLNTEVLQDKTVEKKDINYFITNLETVLKKLK